MHDGFLGLLVQSTPDCAPAVVHRVTPLLSVNTALEARVKGAAVLGPQCASDTTQAKCSADLEA